MIRIGMVTGEYPPDEGGVGAYTRLLARALVDGGAYVAVYTHHNAVEPDIRLQVRAQVERWNIAAVRALAHWAAEQQLDVIDLQFQTAAYGMSPWIHALPHLVRQPVVTTFHDLRVPYLFPKAGPIRRWVVRQLAAASAGVIATNHEDDAQLAWHPQRALIPIGSNVSSDAPLDRDGWRARHGLPADRPLVGYFGLVNESKGLPTLLQALHRLRASGRTAHLVVIGGGVGSNDPTNRAALLGFEAELDRLDLRPAVQRTGFVSDDDASRWLRACDVVALPFRDGASYRRGTLMAAIANGCALVTTVPRLAIPDFRDGETMLLVPPDDATLLAAALRRLLDDDALRQRVQARARALAAQFTWPHIASETLHFIETLLAQRTSHTLPNRV